MASSWQNQYSLPQPAYNSWSNEKSSHEELTFIDFFPEVEKPAGIITRQKFKDFKSTLDRANNWLRANPQWQVKTCESVVFKDSEKSIESEKMVYIERGGIPVLKVRALRLWVSPRKDGDEKYQQIGYTCLVPEETKPGGFFSSPEYEKLDDVVNKFNRNNRYQPIPGRILSVSTEEMILGSKSHPDTSNWMESRNTTNRYLYILRIFYEISEPHCEEIGIKDFSPSLTQKRGVFTSPNYETFYYVVNKVSNWCTQQGDLKICNFQSLDIKLDFGQDILLTTQTMRFSQDSEISIDYVRILRVVYIKSMANTKLYPSLSSPISQISCKTFIPVPISSGVFMPDFETLQQTKARITAWIKATGAQVINAETSCIKVTKAAGGVEFSASITYNSTDREESEYKLYVIRIYLNGQYQDPPPGALPPVPVIKDKNCVIS